ncbi:MAG: M23 family metallopeptidase [Candidatus Aminicenantes bacterium]|nr:M23 family metallopeptidase [Candidatus Aminicenantes bacterium]NLH76427.1 M23 family metallopeptidase [Acidobacteriota bacterium]
MPKNHLSVIIVPHTKTSTRTLCFSRRTLKILAAAGAVLALFLTAVLVDYVRMSVIRGRYKALMAETAEQRTLIAGYEKSITELRSTISHFESYTKKLNVMAGLKSPDVLTAPAGIGGGEPDKDVPEPEPEPIQVPGGSGPQVLTPGTIQNLSQKAQSIESNLNSLLSFFESDSLRLATTPSIMPAAGWISSVYGHRNDPFTGAWVMHWGLDISTNIGNPILATADGIVIKVETDKYLGKNVTISHGNGFTTVYGHMSNFNVKAGQRVKRRDIIGYIGQTGKAAGPHVHYEVFRDGKRVDPRSFLLEE